MHNLSHTTAVVAEFDEVTPGMDSSYDITCYSLGVKFATGAFSIAFEYNMGVNWNYSNFVLGPWDPGPQLNGTRVEDTEHVGYWVDLANGTGTIHAIYGMESSTAWTASGDQERERTMMGVNWSIGVAKTFIIMPEYFVYNWGKVRTPGATTTELGKETLMGVQFRIVF